MTESGAGTSRIAVLGQYCVAIVMGVIILPYLVGPEALVSASTSPEVNNLIWGGLSVILAIWILWLSFVAIRHVEADVQKLPRGRIQGRAASPRVLATFFIALIDLIILNAILRQPLSAILALRWSLVTAEGSIGVVAAVLLLILLVRLHFVARPYVEGSALSALDVFVATTSSEALNPTALDNSSTRAAVTGHPVKTAAPLRPEIEQSTLPDRDRSFDGVDETIADARTAGPELAGDVAETIPNAPNLSSGAHPG